MQEEARFQHFVASTTPVALDDLHEFFDVLEPIEPAFMLGEWEGGVFNTGHPGERQLGALQWVGKTFRGANDVDPIVSRTGDGKREANPVLGSASLRAVSYRGVVTATMVYDQHPIFDHFRRITDDIVLGVMDRKGDTTPLFFYLRRL
ncbi:MAG: DUF4334 domain-containing protein [Polyangiaceae bacterium]|nr:DUF4334 domain-containing protein [Polyangiaceae bacterium]